MYVCIVCRIRKRERVKVCDLCVTLWNDIIITAVPFIRSVRTLVHPVALQLVADAVAIRAAEFSISATCSIHHTHAHLKMHCPLTHVSPPASSRSFVILQQAAICGLQASPLLFRIYRPRHVSRQTKRHQIRVAYEWCN